MKKSYGMLFCIVPYFVMLFIRAVGITLLGSVFSDGLALDYNTYVIYVLSLLAVVYIAVFGVWYYFGVARDRKVEDGSFWNLKSLILLILLGIAVQLSVSYLLFFIFSLLPSLAQSYSALMSPLVALSPVSIIYVGILSPIGEECIFRGLIMHYAEDNASFYVANILQAALFGVFHGNLVQGIYAFLLGLLLGYLVKLSGSIFGGMIFHSALNFAGLYLERLLPETIPAAVKAVLMIGAAVICVGIVRKLKKQPMEAA